MQLYLIPHGFAFMSATIVATLYVWRRPRLVKRRQWRGYGLAFLYMLIHTTLLAYCDELSRLGQWMRSL